jgi:uncharacterized Zn finger protein
MSWNYFGFRPYVSVAERRRSAQREVTKLAKKGKTIQPVNLEGRTIARTFWGKAWCDNLESYMDYENRLPRGRSYVRNGSVVHLEVRAGQIEAMVSGSVLYRVKIGIAPAAAAKWKTLCRECAGGIGSLVELLQGRLSDRVMGIITRKETGLFPSPKEIKLQCSCPDWATMCKHVAAVLYGVGARLDQNPELLFVLRSVDHEDLITRAAAATDLTAKTALAGPELAESEIGSVFGIELDTQTAATQTAAPRPTKPKASAKTRKTPLDQARHQAKNAVAAKSKIRQKEPSATKIRKRPKARR